MQLRSVVRALAAGAMASIAAASTIAAAYTLAEYPAPFVSDSTVNTLIVVGEDAHPSDVVGAIDLAARLGAVPQTTKTGTVEVEVPGTAAAETISGEGVSLATVGEQIHFKDEISEVKNVLTESELPTLLDTLTFQDDEGTTYQYSQYIELGNNKVDFVQKESNEDPVIAVVMNTNLDTTAKTYLYKVEISFNKAVNFTDPDVEGNTITLLGKTFTVAPENDVSNNDELVLYGAAEEVTLSKDESTTVTVGGVEYTITVLGFEDNSVILKVEKEGTSETDDVEEGSSKKINDLQIYAKNVWSYNQGTEGGAVLMLGSEKYVFQNNSAVAYGTDEEDIEGTKVYFGEGETVDALTSLTIYVYAPDTDNKYIDLGEAFVDPVFGTFKVLLNSVTPDLKAETRDKIEFKVSGDNKAYVRLTDSKGNEADVYFAYNGTSNDVAGIALADSSGYSIYVVENATAQEDRYIFLAPGDAKRTHLVKVKDIKVDVDNNIDDYVEFTDVITGETYKTKMFNADNTNTTTLTVDGKQYNVVVTNGNTVAVNYDDSKYVVYPAIELAKGEKIAFMDDVQLMTNAVNGDSETFYLPTSTDGITIDITVTDNGDTHNVTATVSITGDDSKSIWLINDESDGSDVLVNTTTIQVGQVSYRINATLSADADGDTSNDYVNVTLYPMKDSTTLTVPTVIIMEEKDDENEYHAVIVPTKEGEEIEYDTPGFTNSVNSGAVDTSDDELDVYLDYYGTYAEYKDPSGGQATVTVYYPDEQMTFNLYLLAKDASVSTTEATTGGTVTKEYTYSEVVPITTPIAKLDSEVTDADKTTKHLILVGGPCVNDLVAELAAAEKLKVDGEVLTCDAWNAKTAAGDEFGLIELIEDAFADGKVALVVAGSRAPQTREACKVLQDYVANKDKLKGTAVKIVSGVITPVTISE